MIPVVASNGAVIPAEHVATFHRFLKAWLQRCDEVLAARRPAELAATEAGGSHGNEDAGSGADAGDPGE